MYFISLFLDPSLPALQHIRRYLRSAGRYGASPFLVGHYGGIGEVAQGFCRVAAVQGGIYILGREVSAISHSVHSEQLPPSDSPSRRFSVKLADFDEELHCDVVVSADDYLSPDFRSQAVRFTGSSTSEAHFPVARCIAIVDRPIAFRNEGPASSSPSPPEEEESDTPVADSPTSTAQVDTALLIFPPSSVEGGSTTTSVNVLVSGEASLAAPRGHCKHCLFCG